jgi:RimJ/RimL family protein N-acetyltransferase
MVELSDGTRALIRPIEPDDKLQMAGCLSCLSRETIHKRFLAAKPRFTSAELRYLTEVDGVDHIALVAALADEPEVLLGVVRCVRLEQGGDTAEMAIVVGDEWQGKGLGRALAARLSEAAAAAGIRRLTATMLADNEPAQRVIRGVAQRFHEGRVQSGVRDVVAEIAA